MFTISRPNCNRQKIKYMSPTGVTRVPPAIPRSTRVPQTGVFPTAILKKTAPFHSSLSECGNSQTQAVSDTFQKVTASNKSGMF